MLINNRFRLDVSRSEVVDQLTGNSIRLEPRLMKLLCLLIENRGQTVKREFIIKEIWNDYPGAGEGLNQAISGLRKLLGDDEKKIIETLPKNGYCFRGIVEEAHFKHQIQVRSFKKTYILMGVLIVVAILFLVRYYQSTEAVISEQLSKEEARNLSKMDSIHQEEQLKKMRTKEE